MIKIKVNACRKFNSSWSVTGYSLDMNALIIKYLNAAVGMVSNSYAAILAYGHTPWKHKFTITIASCPKRAYFHIAVIVVWHCLSHINRTSIANHKFSKCGQLFTLSHTNCWSKSYVPHFWYLRCHLYEVNIPELSQKRSFLLNKSLWWQWINLLLHPLICIIGICC